MACIYLLNSRGGTRSFDIDITYFYPIIVTPYSYDGLLIQPDIRTLSCAILVQTKTQTPLRHSETQRFWVSVEVLSVEISCLCRLLIYTDNDVHLNLDFNYPCKVCNHWKRLKFLKYILDETITSMIRQVYVTLKEDSRKEAFVDLVRQYFEEVEIDLTEEDISNILKNDWKKYVHEKVKDASLKDLVNGNEVKSKTKHIVFDKLEMSEY